MAGGGEGGDLIEEELGAAAAAPFDDEAERQMCDPLGPADDVEELIEGDADDGSSDSEYVDTDLEDNTYTSEEEDLFTTPSANDAEYNRLCVKRRAVPVTHFVKSVLADGADCTTLELSNHGLGYGGAVALAKALEDNEVLTKIVLLGNTIGNQGGAALAAVLAKNTTVETLDLSDNEMSRGCAKALTTLVATNTHITYLNLSRNAFDDAVGLALADAIGSNRAIETLNLSHNNFGEQCGEALGSAIEANGVLVDLDLSWNKFRGAGGAAVAVGAIKSASLKTLDLTQNGLGDAGAEAIAAVLGDNKTLEELKLARTRIQKAGSMALAKALETETSLRLLELSGNAIGDPKSDAPDADEGILVWLKTCSVNHKLQTLDMRRVSNCASTSTQVWNFIQRSADLHSAIVTREGVERALKQAEHHATALDQKRVELEDLEAAHRTRLDEQNGAGLGATIGKIALLKAQLARLAGGKVATAWADLTALPSRAHNLIRPDGTPITAARDACAAALASDPTDAERPITAAYEAYVSAPGGAAADVGEAKFQAGYAALSGACAAEAAKVAFAAVAEHDEAAAAAAANAAFVTGFGVPHTFARKMYASLMAKHQHSQQPAVDGAREHFASLGGNEAFDPVLELAEAEAIRQAADVMLAAYPERDAPAASADDGVKDLFNDEVNEAMEQGIKKHKEYFGRTEVGTLREVLQLHVAEIEYRRALDAEVVDATETLTRRKKKHDTAMAAEKTARDADHESGTRPDLAFKLDFGVRTADVTFASLDWLTAFERAIEALDMSHFDFFSSVDLMTQGYITVQQLKLWLEKNPLEMTERQLAHLVEQLRAGGGGGADPDPADATDDADDDKAAAALAASPTDKQDITNTMTYAEFLHRLYLDTLRE